MESAISDPFSTLSYELIFAIITCFSSPKDLISILQASPSVYGTFLNGKSHILLQIARNAFEPAALSAAVIALRYSKTSITKQDSCGNPDHAVNERFRLLGQLLNGAKRYPKLDEAVGLCKLLSSIEAFIPACCTAFLIRVTKPPEPETRFSEARFDASTRNPQTMEDLALSPTELGRFQRGFVRYLTFQTLISQLPPGRRLWTWEVAAQLDNLPPWEVEEAVTLHRYFLHRLRRIVGDEDDDDDHQPNSVRGTTFTQSKNIPQLNSTSSDSRHDTNNKDNQLATFPLAIFQRLLATTKGHQGYIHDTYNDNDAARPDIFQAAVTKYESPSWRAAWASDIASTADQPHAQVQAQSQPATRLDVKKLKFDGDDLCKPSIGALLGRPSYSPHGDRADSGFRGLGACFWDRGRLEELGQGYLVQDVLWRGGDDDAQEYGIIG